MCHLQGVEMYPAAVLDYNRDPISPRLPLSDYPTAHSPRLHF